MKALLRTQIPVLEWREPPSGVKHIDTRTWLPKPTPGWGHGPTRPGARVSTDPRLPTLLWRGISLANRIWWPAPRSTWQSSEFRWRRAWPTLKYLIFCSTLYFTFASSKSFQTGRLSFVFHSLHSKSFQMGRPHFHSHLYVSVLPCSKRFVILLIHSLSPSPLFCL